MVRASLMSPMLDIQISFLLVIIFTCLVALVILVVYGKMHTTSTTTVRLPPGPRKLPLIGNLHQMAASSLHPPPLIPRQASEKCTIGGYDIPTEATAFVNAWGIGRDPKYWENADCFLPERFQGSSVDFRGTNFELVPFGGGRRMCPGMSFATAGIELVLSHLLYHFDWKLPNANGSGNETKLIEELDMTECKGLNVRKMNNLYLIAIPFISSSEMN